MQESLFEFDVSGWTVVSGSDERALSIVDGTGVHELHGPHYSRRTPGARTFTGCGKDIVLLHRSGLALWSVILQRPPVGDYQLWRNNVFRRLPGCPELASDCIRGAMDATAFFWRRKYGSIPDQVMRTEVDTRKIKSKNPGYCYTQAGWVKGETVRGKLYLYEPPDWRSGLQ